jgi:hypothetical protein
VTIKVWQAAIFVLLDVAVPDAARRPSPALAKTATTSMTASMRVIMASLQSPRRLPKI